MSKVVTSLGAGVMVAGLAAAGTYMFGGFSSFNAKLPEEVGKLAEAGGGDCINRLFPGLDPKTLATSTSATGEFTLPSASVDKPSRSCLAINWRRNDHKNDEKWSGNFRWLWTFAAEDKGFVMFNVATSADQKLTLTGNIYLLSKDSNTGKWSVGNHKAATPSKEVDKSKFDEAFPSVGEVFADQFKDLKENKDNWGFIKDKDMVEKSISASTSGNSIVKTTAFEGAWTWKSGDKSEGTLIKWSKEMEKWPKNLYDSLNLKDSLASLKGEWSARVLVQTTETSKTA